MAVTKMSISLNAELAADIRDAAVIEGRSVSAFVAEIMGRHLRLRGLDAWLDEWEAEHGAFTDEELAAADRALGSNGSPAT